MNEEHLGTDSGPEVAASPKPYPFWSYPDVALLLGFALPVLVFSAVLVKGLSLVVPGEFVKPAVGVLLGQFVGYGLWFLCLWGLFRLKYRQPFWVSLAWVRPPRPMSFYAFLGPVVAISVAVVGALLQTPDLDMPIKELLEDRVSLVLVGVFAITLGPVCEELVFRGLILPLLSRSAGPAVGILVTAAVFSLLHGPQYAWSWRHVLLITLAGAAFGAVRVWSDSTSAATIMHATYNLTFFIGYLAQWDQVHV